MKVITLCLQLASALAALIAAGLWFWAASVETPEATYEGIGRLKPALDTAANRNRIAAGVTGLSVLFAAVATICEMLT
jgi:hypothetical protein